MAEETIRYTIQIDDSDIAQQLQTIRQQINQTVSDAFNFSSTDQLVSPALQTAQINNLSAVTPISSIAGVTPDLTQIISSANDIANTAFSVPQDPTYMRQILNNMSAGISNFYQDVSAGIQIAQQGIKDSINNSTFLGSLGFGYDYTSPIPITDYMEANKESLREKVYGTLKEHALGAVSLGLFGASIAVPPLAPLAIAAGIADLALSPLVDEAEKQNQMIEGLQTMARMSHIPLSRSDASDIVKSMTSKAYSFQGILENYSLDEISANVLSFAEAGGFINSGSTERFTEKVNTIIENARTIAKALGTFTEQAMTIMGELDAKNISPIENALPFIAKMQYSAGLAGTSVNELLQYGLQGAEMVRGTDLGAKAGFDLMVDARTMAGIFANSASPELRDIIYEAGGQSAAAQLLAQTTLAYAMGPYGVMRSAAIASGKENADLLSNAEAYASYIAENPQNYFALISSAGRRAGEFSLQQNAVDMAYQTLDLLYKSGIVDEDSKVSTDVVAGAMMKQYGLSYAQAQLVLNTALTPIDPEKEQEATLYNMYKDITQANVMGGLRGISYNLGFGAVYDVLEGAYLLRTKPWEIISHTKFGTALGEVLNEGYKSTANVFQSIADWFTGTVRVRPNDILGKDLNEEIITALFGKNKYVNTLKKLWENSPAGQAFKKANTAIISEQDKIFMAELQKLTGDVNSADVQKVIEAGSKYDKSTFQSFTSIQQVYDYISKTTFGDEFKNLTKSQQIALRDRIKLFTNTLGLDRFLSKENTAEYVVKEREAFDNYAWNILKGLQSDGTFLHNIYDGNTFNNWARSKGLNLLTSELDVGRKAGKITDEEYNKAIGAYLMYVDDVNAVISGEKKSFKSIEDYAPAKFKNIFKEIGNAIPEQYKAAVLEVASYRLRKQYEDIIRQNLSKDVPEYARETIIQQQTDEALRLGLGNMDLVIETVYKGSLKDDMLKQFNEALENKDFKKIQELASTVRKQAVLSGSITADEVESKFNFKLPKIEEKNNIILSELYQILKNWNENGIKTK